MEAPVITSSQQSPVAPFAWNEGLLAGLDWKRRLWLVMRLLSHGGYEPSVRWVRPDAAAAVLAKTAGSGPESSAALLALCAPWGLRECGAGLVSDLFQAMTREGASRGLLVSASPFTAEARAFAAGRAITLVDGPSLSQSLRRLPADWQEACRQLLASPDRDAPSCPLCGNPMTLRAEDAIEGPDAPHDLHLAGRQSIPTVVRCRRLAIPSGADIVFTREVHAEEAVIAGRVSGNLTIQGRLRVASGGQLTGLAAARTFDVAEDACVDAEMQILNAAIVPPVRRLPPLRHWRCTAASGCRGRLPARG